MVKKKPSIEPLKKDMPIYPIGVAAKLLDIHPRTLRIYEEEGLIKPFRQGNRRLYAANDLTWITCLRKIIHEDGISIPGLKKLLRYAPCYEIAECSEKYSCSCDAVVDRAVPKSLRLAGDRVAEKAAKEKELLSKEKERKNMDKVEENRKILD